MDVIGQFKRTKISQKRWSQLVSKSRKRGKTVCFWKFFLKIHNLRFFIINVKYFLIFSEEKSYIFQKGIIYQDWSRSSYLNPMSKSLQLFWVTLYIFEITLLLTFVNMSTRYIYSRHRTSIRATNKVLWRWPDIIDND